MRYVWLICLKDLRQRLRDRTALMIAVVVPLVLTALMGFALGGSDTNGSPLATVEVYDPSTNSWTTAAPMPTARVDLAAVSVNGKIYALFGSDSTGLQSTVEVYDPSANSWSTALTPFGNLAGFNGFAAASVNGQIYVLGGFISGSGSGATNATVLVYDPVANTWSFPAPPMPTPRFGLAAVSLNGKIYAIGGSSNGVNGLSVVEVYDPVANTWSTAAAPMPTASFGLAADAVNGKIYAMGGLGNGGISGGAAEMYDPVANTWSTEANMPTARYLLAAADANGLIYAIGGSNISTPLSAPIVPGVPVLPVLSTAEQYSPPVTIYTFIKN